MRRKMLKAVRLTPRLMVPDILSTSRHFPKTLVQHYDPSSLPKYDDVLKVVDQIPVARAEATTKALPAIFRALSHTDE